MHDPAWLQTGLFPGVLSKTDTDAADSSPFSGGHYFVTFEPMFDDIGEVDLSGMEWIVVGTETGRRKGRSVSHPEWVLNLTDQAHEMGIPVFMKEDLIPIMSEEQMVQELPTAFNKS